MSDDDLAGIPCALGSLLLVAPFVVALWSAWRDGRRRPPEPRAFDGLPHGGGPYTEPAAPR